MPASQRTLTPIPGARAYARVRGPVDPPEGAATPPPGPPGPPEGTPEGGAGVTVSGAPSSGPPSTTTGGTTTGGTTTGGTTGGSTGNGSEGVPFPGEAFAADFAESFLGLIQNATSGAALEAQNIILRRIALEGDVVPSRVPAPLNITQIGGYLNLLSGLGETDMQSQVLAGILGVAGPNPPLGWLGSTPPLSFAPLANDRPEGPAQATIPVTVPVRSDFLPGLQAVVAKLHEEGCLVPFTGGPSTLPAAQSNGAGPIDPLPYIGRVLTLAAGAALSEPGTDALALARAKETTAPFQIAAVARGTGAASITPADYEALVCTSTACAPTVMTGATLVYLEPVLASAGFYPAKPPPQPTSSTDTAWARLTNITGLQSGTTKLGDELSLLYPASAVAESVFAGSLGWIWNGREFAAPA